jgi:hypothetical protein
MMNSCAFAARAARSTARAKRRQRVRDVGAHRVVEQHRLLRHHAEVAPQRARADLAQVDAIDRDAAAVGS